MFSSGSPKKASLNKLLDTLMNQGVIKNPKVSIAMRKVDRADFCPGFYCYEDAPQPINYNSTISAPHMHAYVLVSISNIFSCTSYIIFKGMAERCIGSWSKST